MKQVNLPVNVRTSSIAHPIRSTREFFEKHLKTEPSRHHFHVSFAGVVIAAILVPLIITVVAIAKPPPFYGPNRPKSPVSVFGYYQNSRTDGMDGRTDFIVKEIGATFTPPVSTNVAGVKVSGTVAAVDGTTECEGLPMANSNFYKVTGNLHFTYGNFEVTPGYRYVVSETPEWSMKAGPMTLTFPDKTYFDADIGLKGKWERPHHEKGFWRKVTASATEFRTRHSVGETYNVYAASVDVTKGWGAELSKDTKSQNVTAGVNKGYAWKRGQYVVSIGAGYGFKTSEAYGYTFGKAGPFSLLLARADETGDPTNLAMLAVDPFGVYRMVAGK
jgi:hypothetical protein